MSSGVPFQNTLGGPGKGGVSASSAQHLNDTHNAPSSHSMPHSRPFPPPSSAYYSGSTQGQRQGLGVGPPGSMAPFKDLLRAKQEELMSLHEARVLHAEEIAQRKTQEVELLQQQLHKLREDYEYNLSLVDERDADLDKLEDEVEKVQKQLAEAVAREESMRIDYDRRIRELQSVIEVLKTSESTLSEENTRLSSRALAAETARAEEVQSIRTTLEGVIRNLNEKLRKTEHDCQEQLRRFTEEHARIREEREKFLDSMLKQKDEESGVAKARVLRLEDEVMTLRTLLEEREEYTVKLGKQHSDMEVSLARERDEHLRAVEDYEKALEHLRDNSEDWRKKCQLACMERDAAVKRREDMEVECERRVGEAEVKVQRTEEYWSEKMGMGAENREKQLQELLDQVNLLRTKHKESIQKMKSEYKLKESKWEKQVEESRFRVSKVEELMETMRTEHVEKVQQAQDEIWRREDENNTLRSRLRVAENEVQRSVKDIDSLHAELEKVRAQLYGGEETWAEREKEWEERQRELEDVERRVSARLKVLEADNTRLRKECESLITQRSELEMNLEKERREQHDMLSRVRLENIAMSESKNKVIDELRHQLEQERQRAEVAEDNANRMAGNLREEREIRLKEQDADAQALEVVLNKVRSQHRDENARMEKEMMDIQKENSRLLHDIEQINEEAQELARRLEEYTRKMEQIEIEKKDLQQEVDIARNSLEEVRATMHEWELPLDAWGKDISSIAVYNLLEKGGPDAVVEGVKKICGTEPGRRAQIVREMSANPMWKDIFRALVGRNFEDSENQRGHLSGRTRTTREETDGRSEGSSNSGRNSHFSDTLPEIDLDDSMFQYKSPRTDLDENQEMRKSGRRYISGKTPFPDLSSRKESLGLFSDDAEMSISEFASVSLPNSVPSTARYMASQATIPSHTTSHRNNLTRTHTTTATLNPNANTDIYPSHARPTDYDDDDAGMVYNTQVHHRSDFMHPSAFEKPLRQEAQRRVEDYTRDARTPGIPDGMSPLSPEEGTHTSMRGFNTGMGMGTGTGAQVDMETLASRIREDLMRQMQGEMAALKQIVEKNTSKTSEKSDFPASISENTRKQDDMAQKQPSKHVSSEAPADDSDSEQIQGVNVRVSLPNNAPNTPTHSHTRPSVAQITGVLPHQLGTPIPVDVSALYERVKELESLVVRTSRERDTVMKTNTKLKAVINNTASTLSAPNSPADVHYGAARPPQSGYGAPHQHPGTFASEAPPYTRTVAGPGPGAGTGTGTGMGTGTGTGTGSGGSIGAEYVRLVQQMTETAYDIPVDPLSGRTMYPGKNEQNSGNDEFLPSRVHFDDKMSIEVQITPKKSRNRPRLTSSTPITTTNPYSPARPGNSPAISGNPAYSGDAHLRSRSGELDVRAGDRDKSADTRFADRDSRLPSASPVAMVVGGTGLSDYARMGGVKASERATSSQLLVAQQMRERKAQKENERERRVQAKAEMVARLRSTRDRVREDGENARE